MIGMDDKVDLDHMGAVMALPPAPLVLVGVADREWKERNIITVGMFNVFSVRPPIIGIGVTTARYSYKLLEENDGAGNTFKATAKPVLIGTAVVGATTMIVSHNAGIAAMADRVVRFRDGRIVETTVNAHKIAPKEMSW